MLQIGIEKIVIHKERSCMINALLKEIDPVEREFIEETGLLAQYEEFVSELNDGPQSKLMKKIVFKNFMVLIRRRWSSQEMKEIAEFFKTTAGRKWFIHYDLLIDDLNTMGQAIKAQIHADFMFEELQVDNPFPEDTEDPAEKFIQ